MVEEIPSATGESPAADGIFFSVSGVAACGLIFHCSNIKNLCMGNRPASNGAFLAESAVYRVPNYRQEVPYVRWS